MKSRQSVDLFNVAPFRAKTKTTGILMRELLFIDASDNALVVHVAEDMQTIVDAFSDASKKFGLKINIKNTEVLYQPNSTRTREDDIMVDGNKLNSVLEFTYFGSTISSNGWYLFYYACLLAGSIGHQSRNATVFCPWPSSPFLSWCIPSPFYLFPCLFARCFVAYLFASSLGGSM